MKNYYLAAAIIGAVIPYAFFIDFFLSEGIAPMVFMQGIFANGAAGGFAADIVLSSVVFWTYLSVNKEAGIWKYVALNLTIGLSCALPYYLYVKAREQDVAA